MLARACLLARRRLTLIGCGGVASGRDAWEKIRAGASLVQLYTAFAYEGPAVIPRIKAELLAIVGASGYARLQDAVGTAAAERAGAGPWNTSADSPPLPGNTTDSSSTFGA
jgi:dihydroorotate dehydrogenase